VETLYNLLNKEINIIVFHIFMSRFYISYSNVNEISYFKDIANCI
jgi:hypothetical protein